MIGFLALQDCMIIDGTASAVALAMALLFPNLGAGQGSLTLGTSFIHTDFLSIFAAQSQLQELHITECEMLIGTTDLTPVLANFKHLTYLSLGLKRMADLQLEPLSRLVQLRTLVLSHCTPRGLDALLPQLPNLSTLKLHQLNMGPSAGMHLASSTVQTVEVEGMSLDFPTITAVSFPVLQTIRVFGLSLGANYQSVNDFDGKAVLAKVTAIARWLTVLPLVFGSAPLGELRLLGSSTWAPELVVQIFKALAPLKPQLATVKHLFLNHWQLLHVDSMSVLCGLLDNDAELLVLGGACSYGGGLKRGLLEAVHMLPGLRRLRIAKLLDLPRDAIAACTAAHRAGRCFKLELGLGGASISPA